MSCCGSTPCWIASLALSCRNLLPRFQHGPVGPPSRARDVLRNRRPGAACCCVYLRVTFPEPPPDAVGLFCRNPSERQPHGLRRRKPVLRSPALPAACRWRRPRAAPPASRGPSRRDWPAVLDLFCQNPRVRRRRDRPLGVQALRSLAAQMGQPVLERHGAGGSLGRELKAFAASHEQIESDAEHDV
jgi:hypothetical protein